MMSIGSVIRKNEDREKLRKDMEEFVRKGGAISHIKNSVPPVKIHKPAFAGL